jgi:hypothetical protein
MGYHKAVPGAGFLALRPYGATNPSGVELARIASVSIDVKEEDVPLLDENGDELDAFVKSQTVTGKFEVTEFSAQLFSAASRGSTVSAGGKIGGVHTGVIPTTPFQITPSVSGGTFAEALVVVDLTAGKRMTRGATATGAGVYSVNETTGVYTFNTADAGHTVLIRYRYTSTTAGQTTEIAAVAASASAKFELYGINLTAGFQSGFYVPYARIPGFSVSLKPDGWSASSLEFRALLSPIGKKIFFYSPE